MRLSFNELEAFSFPFRLRVDLGFNFIVLGFTVEDGKLLEVSIFLRKDI